MCNSIEESENNYAERKKPTKKEITHIQLWKMKMNAGSESS